MANYPNYKPKYKSLSKKDKADAKYISKTTPAQRQFNRVAGDVVSTIAAPMASLKLIKPVAQIVPKATRVVKELASKFTQSKKTLPEAMPGKEKLKPLEPLGRPFKDKKEKELYGRFQQRMKKHGFFKDE